MQARLDPDLLFDSLAAIDDGYARGVECGQQRLDEMIRFLRAALPSDSAGTSTVAREREIVEAYVALHAQRTPEAADLSVEIDAGAHYEQMPPMLLLPLVRSALAARSARHLRVLIGRSARTLVVAIESDASSDDVAPLDEIASVRQRLNRLYAEGAQLSVVGGARPWQMLLEIPRPQAAAA
jgi:LytS/YehU family sensor histidine kinase